MDCIEGMKLMPDQCIDLVITDPPFGIDFKAKRSNYNRKSSRVIDGYNEIQGDDYYNFTVSWMEEVKRVLKKSGSMYVFSGWNYLRDILNALNALGFQIVNHIIWKYQFGVVTRRKFVTSHYHCLYVCIDDDRRRFYPYSRFEKRALNSQGRSLHYSDKEDVWAIPHTDEDVWYINREYWTGDRKTPTKLPLELIRKILAYSSQPGDVVMDPFLGSGQVAVVSKLMSRQFVGFEIVKSYFEFAKQRLEMGVYRMKDEGNIEDVNVNLQLFEQDSLYSNQMTAASKKGKIPSVPHRRKR